MNCCSAEGYVSSPGHAICRMYEGGFGNGTVRSITQTTASYQLLSFLSMQVCLLLNTFIRLAILDSVQQPPSWRMHLAWETSPATMAILSYRQSYQNNIGRFNEMILKIWRCLECRASYSVASSSGTQANQRNSLVQFRATE